MKMQEVNSECILELGDEERECGPRIRLHTGELKRERGDAGVIQISEIWISDTKGESENANRGMGMQGANVNTGHDWERQNTKREIWIGEAERESRNADQWMGNAGDRCKRELRFEETWHKTWDMNRKFKTRIWRCGLRNGEWRMDNG
jgi:hypothetical protein